MVLYQVALWTLERLRSMKLVVLGVLDSILVVLSQLPSLLPFDDALIGLVVAGLAAGAFLASPAE